VIKILNVYNKINLLRERYYNAFKEFNKNEAVDGMEEIVALKF
jgi:hypothetical protein